MQKLILLFSLVLSLSSFGAERLVHPDSSPVFATILHNMDSSNLVAADDLDRVIVRSDEGVELAADLILTDLIDQMHLCLYRKKARQTHYRLQDILARKPLENFKLWWAEIEAQAEENSIVEGCRDSLLVQSYDVTGRLLPSNMGGVFKIFRKHWGSEYDKLLADPEGTHIAHYIFLDRKDAEIPNSLFTPRVTVTKYRLYKKLFNRDYRSDYYEEYFSLLEENSGGADLVLKKNKILLNSGDAETVALFNTMYALPFKLELFRYIKHQLLEQHGIPVPEKSWSGMRHILLTPDFIGAHKAIITPMVREFIFTYRLETDDLDSLYQMRKWVRANIGEIQKRSEEKKLFVNLQERYTLLPTNAEVLQNYAALQMLFPETPWAADIIPAQRGRLGRIFNRTKIFLRGMVSLENVSSVVVGTALYFATGNPLLSAISASVVKDLVYAGKYNLNMKNYLPTMLFNAGVSSIIASGFTSGRIPEQIFLGGMVGATEGLITGQSIKVSALVGAVQNVLFGMLPVEWHSPTLKGLGDNLIWTNALLELGELAAKRSLTGAIVAVTTGGDVGEAALAGAAFGAGEAILKITILGFRYRPDLDKIDWSPENQYQHQHGIGADDITDQLFRETEFRRDGLFQLYYDRTFTLGNQVTMDPQAIKDGGVAQHEMSHRSQNRYFGILGFNTRYVMEFTQRGSHGGTGNIYENYRYMNFTRTLPLVGGEENPLLIKLVEGASAVLRSSSF